MRLVLDTDVVVAAMRSPKGASAALLVAIRHKRAVPLLTTGLMLEYEAVCSLAELVSARSLDVVERGRLLPRAHTANAQWRDASGKP